MSPRFIIFVGALLMVISLLRLVADIDFSSYRERPSNDLIRKVGERVTLPPDAHDVSCSVRSDVLFEYAMTTYLSKATVDQIAGLFVIESEVKGWKKLTERRGATSISLQACDGDYHHVVNIATENGVSHVLLQTSWSMHISDPRYCRSDDDRE